MSPINPLELLKSAVAQLDEEFAPTDSDPADAMLYAVHANVLQLEHVAKAIADMTFDDRTVDESIAILGYVENDVVRHIASCDLCIKGMRMFFNLYPTEEELQAVDPNNSQGFSADT